MVQNSIYILVTIAMLDINTKQCCIRDRSLSNNFTMYCLTILHNYVRSQPNAMQWLLLKYLIDNHKPFLSTSLLTSSIIFY